MRSSSARGIHCIATTRVQCGRACAPSCRRSNAPASTRAISTSARSRRTSCAPASSPRPCRRQCAERLARAGIETVGALAALDDEELRTLMPGKVGRLLRDRARGLDTRRLETAIERISISNEETFPRDIDDPALLHAELRRMAERLAEHLRRDGQAARTVTTKLRYPDFSIRTRSLT